MSVKENPKFTEDYYAADKRYIGNAIQVFFKDVPAPTASPWISPSVIANAAPKACPCWSRRWSSPWRPFLPKQSEQIKGMFADKKSSMPCPSRTSWPCS